MDFRLFWFVPAALLLIAVAPLPYGYYQFLRLVVCGSACVILYQAHIAEKQNYTLWSVVLIGLAIIFNPLFPVHLTREIWFWIDLAAAAFLISHAYVAVGLKEKNEPR